jgi:cytochrome c
VSVRRAEWAAIFFAIAAASAGGARAQGANGEDIFNTRCVMCHAPTGGGEGPSLKGVVGRKAASAPGFEYSPALKASGLTWTPAELDRFLTDPQKALPGTAMVVSVPDPAERAALIDYLKSPN